MLNNEQVLKLVLHEDSNIRYRAANYLVKSPAQPPETSDVFWQSFERYGIEGSSIAVPFRFLPQTESSCRRILDALGDKQDDGKAAASLLPALERVPMTFLEPHFDEVVAAAQKAEPEAPQPWKQRKPRQSAEEHLAARRRLKSVAPEQVWKDLELFCLRVARLARSEWDWREDFRLTEALARHPALVIEKCEPLLCDPEGWLGCFALELLRMVRHPPSVDLLIPRLEDPLSCDFEEAQQLLAQRGEQEIVPRLLAEFAARKGEDREHLLDPIRSLYTAGGEHALIELIRSGELTEYEVNRTAQQLVDLFTTDGLELLRELAREGRFDRGFSDLREDVLLLAEAQGVEIPERPQWEEELEADAARRRAMSPQQRLAQFFGRSEGRKVDPASLIAEAPVASSPKIGRNEPCPCGSGKKYKKCCLA